VPLRGRPANEDRRRKRPGENCGVLALRIRKDEKPGEHPLQIPARRETPEGRQRRLFVETGSQGAERFYEARVGKRLGVEARGLRRRGNQNFRRESLVVVAVKRASDPVRRLG